VTSSNGSSGSSPLRVGGLALLGVGVVAGALGLVSLVSGDEEVTPVAAPSMSTTAAAPATTVAAAPAPAPASESAAAAPAPPQAPAAAPPAASTPSPAAPAPAQPPPVLPAPAAAAGADPGSGSDAGTRAAVRVYNNSRITGLAAQAADDFRSAGWTVNQVDNYPSGVIPTSTVYYRPGTGEQSSAQQIGTEFGLRAEPRFAGLADASPGLIVIVTDDYQRR